ncbi:MAG: ACP S-malonyltransferase [Clostridia bacterium]|nr:ACP S-malonyltransferase [Clostridia bacterium]
MNNKAFIFDGQGNKFNNFGKDFYENESSFKGFVNTYKDFLDLENDVYNREENEIDTEIFQPAVFLVEMGIVHLLIDHGIKPKNFAGSSLGEYSAICSANYLKVEDGIKILQKRGNLMKTELSKIESEMRAVMFLENSKVQKIVDEYNCQISNENSYNQVVISGLKEDIEKASNECIARRSKKNC